MFLYILYLYVCYTMHVCYVDWPTRSIRLSVASIPSRLTEVSV